MNSDWRQSALGAWGSVSDQEASQWASHAGEVEVLVTGPEGESGASSGADPDSWAPDDLAILRTAALLHDLGNADDGEGLGVPGNAGREPSRSAAVASQYLAGVDPWRGHGRAIERIHLLIEGLVAVRGVYPTIGHEGRAISVRRAFGETTASSDEHLLRRLREADSRAHLSRAGIDWLVDSAIAARIPLAPEIGSLGYAPCWGTSAVANIRLLAKCAFRDVRSESGRRTLETLYRTAETRVRELCEAVSAPYTPELFDCAAFIAAFEAGPPERYSDATIQIVRSESWNSFRSQIEQVALERDAGVAVYSGAQVRLARARIESLRPTALYVLRDNLGRATDMHRLWLGAYGLSPLDLAATVEWRVDDGDTWPVSPPFLEPDGGHQPPGGAPALSIVDGLHRIQVAKRLGLDAMTCVVVDGAAVPLPVEQVEWHQVQEFDETPSHSAKRVYRFQTAEELLKLGLGFSIAVTDQNAPHLLYRNYRVFGSTGVRSSESTSTH